MCRTILIHCIVLTLGVASVLAGCQDDKQQSVNQGGSRQAGPQATNHGDPGWPRIFEKDKDEVVLYQPQIDDWSDYSKISFRAALAVTPKDRKEPVYGVLTVKAKTFVDHDNRTVLMTDLDTAVRFVNVPEKEAEKLEKITREVLPHKDYLEVSLDRVLACLDASQAKIPRVNVNLDPPPIFRSESPAILMIFAGPPQFKPIKDTKLMYAVNTNWPVFLDTETSRYYLLDGESWIMSPDPLKGPWIAAAGLPVGFSKLPSDASWEDVRKHIPGKPAKDVPKVFASTAPAELIVTDGPPAYTPISDTGLMYVSNPELPLFLDTSDSSYYYLVAGRWFHAKSLDGPWSAASADLPAKFAKIPPDSPVGYVLAAIPNTQQAKDAILLASVPHTATIQRDDARLEVVYDGPPKFADILGTPMQYAVNTQYDVILTGGKCYCCYQGVWFVSPQASGPWAVCTTVPDVIYTIPPACPLYNDTYVRVYSTTPTTVVYGYTAGYSGEYLAATGALMFGAGMLTGAAIADSENWYHCSPAYWSYGCAATYHYGYGGFYGAAAYCGPFGGAGHYAGYNPVTGAFSRGAYHYGPAGAAGFHQAYNPFTNTYRAHAGATNGYQSWGHSVATRGDEWASAGHVSGAAGRAGYVQGSGGRSIAGVQGAGGGAVVKGPEGNLYAGRDGNVYKRSEGGGWEHWGDSGWHPAEQHSSWSDSAFQQRMNNDWASRFHGEDLSSRFSGFRGGDFGGFGGFRGGGFRGGFRR
ncbi:MAG TPA: hypothetical protein VMV94_09170 [Phycisphaerae bacterium]|nr:hypothetical protein [Phycisphaerae bacterium]